MTPHVVKVNEFPGNAYCSDENLGGPTATPGPSQNVITAWVVDALFGSVR